MTDQKVRRATIEDLAALGSLWQTERLNAAELEKRFKDFQVVEDGSGNVIAALGIQVAGQQGHAYAEAFSHPEQADMLRAVLWERVETIAKNFGLTRIWTQLSPPFWQTIGFDPVSAEVLPKLPPDFAGAEDPWYSIQLKEEAPAMAGDISVDQAFALFKQAEQENTNRIMQRARTLKVVAFGIVSAVVVISAIGIYLWFKYKNSAGTP